MSDEIDLITKLQERVGEGSVIQGVVQLVIRMIADRPLAVRNHSSFPAGTDSGRTSHA